METNVIARSFVNFVARGDYLNWRRISGLSADEVMILFNIVAAAGFEPKKVIRGKLLGHCREQGGGETGETYLINTYCQYKVVNQDGDDQGATGWLNSALQLALSSLYPPSTWAEEDAIRAVEGEIERSIPLEPIRLTAEGDLLKEHPRHREYPHSGNYFVNHTRDGHELGYSSSGVGIHVLCKGLVCRIRVSETHDALVCGPGGLRVLFPKKIKTFGELRKFLKENPIPAAAG